MVVTRVETGWDFVLAVTGDGSILSWGSNSFGQLGRNLATGMKMDPTPQFLSLPSADSCKFVSVAAGLRHAVAVSESGCIYSWGSGRRGQLGIVDDQDKPVPGSALPVHVPLLHKEKPIQAVAGMNFSGILTSDGAVYLWGCNKHGQCGVAAVTETILPLPKLLELQHVLSPLHGVSSHSKIVSLAVGWTHVVARMESGDLCSWGRSDLGQIGRGKDQVPAHMPGHIDGVGRVVSHCCSSEHNLALTDTGEVYSWGWNEHGICGTGDEINVFVPRLVPAFKGRRAVSIGCGSGHCFCSTE